MREGKFIDQNKDRWKDYMDDTNDPDIQAERFVHLVDDLSYSKTFYPNSKTTQFINGLAAKQFQFLYQSKKLNYNRLFTFWKYELPLLFGRYHKLYLFTTVFFLLCVFLGVVASKEDPNFVRSILGDGYVEMTEDNIQKGDPFGVYKDGNEFGMFLNIALHNINVSLMTFVLGILGGVGTLYMLFSNGIMLGSFQYMFFAKGLGWQSVLVIWIHGTLEISAIVIAGTAGLILGTSFLFPGTFRRIDSLKRGAKDSVKVIIGLVPFFFLAAFFEGYVTRHTGMPIWLSLSILAGSAAVIVFYFIIYPVALRKSGVKVIDGEVIFPHSTNA
jgi:uncharacterized membrane protein SpoIIM required for sporulation